MIDKYALLGWLDERGKTMGNLVVGVIYTGLAARIRRGDFDEDKDD